MELDPDMNASLNGGYFECSASSLFLRRNRVLVPSIIDGTFSSLPLHTPPSFIDDGQVLEFILSRCSSSK